VPWELYEAYHVARLLADEAVATAADTGTRTAQTRAQRGARRRELLWLLVIWLFPAAAAVAALAWADGHPTAAGALSPLNVTLFLAAAWYRPARLLAGGLRAHAAATQATAARAVAAAVAADAATAADHDSAAQAPWAAVEVDMAGLVARIAALEAHAEAAATALARVPAGTNAVAAAAVDHDDTTRTAALADRVTRLEAWMVAAQRGPPASSKERGLTPRRMAAAALAPFWLPWQLLLATWQVIAAPFARTRRRALPRAHAD
jgi:hypothetical protein